MFGKKLKISDDLYAKLEKAASAMHCSTAEELATMILDREADKILATDDSGTEVGEDEAEKIREKLKGLGYLE